MAKPTLNKTPRKFIYAAVIAVVIAVWIIVEAIIPGVTGTLSTAAEEVVDRLGSTIPTVAALVVSVLALLNLSDDDEPDLHDPVEE